MRDAIADPHATATALVRSRPQPSPLMHILAWTCIGALAYGRHLLQLTGSGSAHANLAEYLEWMSCFAPSALFGALIFRFERRFALGGSRWPRNAAVLASLGLLFAYLAAQIASYLGTLVEFSFSSSLVAPTPLPAPLFSWIPQQGEFAIQLFLFSSMVAASYVIRHLAKLQDGEREKTQLLLEKSRLEASLRQAELEALRMRLNPHFLFNTLQNISVLTQQDPATASQMLTRLGDLLRIAIRSGSDQETDLATEIRLTEAYASLEKMRFADRLRIIFEIAPETAHATVPTLLLQPLLENAIKHGLRGISREGLVCIRSGRENDQLRLTVTDNGIGPPPDAPVSIHDVLHPAAKREAGIGLGATTQRLDRLYPGANHFSISRLPQGGTEVRILLPFRPVSSTAVPVEIHDRRTDIRHDQKSAFVHR